jgi:hypothetical protein
MTMDALTWFKTAFRHGLTTPAPFRADVATERWADVPLHLAAARLRPSPAPADAHEADDEDWDAVIARAKMQAAETQKTPPPLLPAPQAVRARLDAAAWGGRKKAPEDMVTPPPVGTARRAPRPLIGPAGIAFRGPSGRSRG